jgi:hypothetical protein
MSFFLTPHGVPRNLFAFMAIAGLSDEPMPHPSLMWLLLQDPCADKTIWYSPLPPPRLQSKRSVFEAIPHKN